MKPKSTLFETKLISNFPQNRYQWVDVSKAIAMIFVYLGHWTTPYLEAFAYSFHLQLFFVVAGFFALKTTKRTAKEWVAKQATSLFLPYLLWVLISFWFNNIDTADFSNINWSSILCTPNGMQPNYWFFPAFMAVTAVYYIAYKIFKRPIGIFVLAFVLHLFFGEIPIIDLPINVFKDTESWIYPLKIVNNWISISAVPQYLVWYSFGAIVFEKIAQFTEMKESKPSVFYGMGFVTGVLSLVIFFPLLLNLDSTRQMVYRNNITFVFYRICSCLIILTFIFFLSKLMETSQILNDIGRGSMNFMGLEYITHGWFALSFLPMINLGIPNLNTTICVVNITIIQIAINLWMSNRINKYIPVLNGDGFKRKK